MTRAGQAVTAPAAPRGAVVPFLLLLFALFPTLAALVWVGFTASDDASYLDRALRWLAGEAALPRDHWGFRHTLILPLAAVLALFGDTPATLGGAALAWGLALLALLVALTARFAGAREAAWAGLLAATSPLLVVSASTLNVDLPEALFALASLGLFVAATQRPAPAPWLLLAGLAAGLAVLTRETALGLLPVYGLFFLRGAYFPRTLYLWGALGAALPVAAEMAWFLAEGAGPFHRFETILRTHDVLAGGADPAFGTGNVSSHPLWGPPLALLLNQEFGLLFVLAPVAGWAAWRGRPAAGAGRAFVEVAVVAMAVWVLWIGYSRTVYPLPRYFAFSTVLACALAGIWLARLRSRRLAAVLAGGAVAVNLLCLSVENTAPRFAARALAGFVADHPGLRVHTDPTTLRRTALMLRWSGVDPARVLDGRPPAPGGLLFHDPNVDPAPAPPGAPLWVVEPPRRPLGRALAALGADVLLPETARERVLHAGRPAALYRVARSETAFRPPLQPAQLR